MGDRHYRNKWPRKYNQVNLLPTNWNGQMGFLNEFTLRGFFTLFSGNYSHLLVLKKIPKNVETESMTEMVAPARLWSLQLAGLFGETCMKSKTLISCLPFYL